MLKKIIMSIIFVGFSILEIYANNDLNYNITMNLFQNNYEINIDVRQNDLIISSDKYKKQYSKYEFYKSIEYEYGTTEIQKNKINITVTIINHTDTWLKDILYGHEDYFYGLIERENDTQATIYLKDLFVNLGDSFILLFSDFPVFETPPFNINERHWALVNRVFADNELILLTNKQLRILKNSVYAFRGFDFTEKDLQDYFKKQDWYIVNPNFSESLFTENEKTNIRKIENEEKSRK
jgi:hypothetical protein